ncbi:MAG: protein kinase, partial [Oscillospiraceae bacterium]
ENQILNDTYRIEKQIGSGGGGVVYKAYHLRLKKYVAVKLIKDTVKGAINERAEADILKGLKHEGLPQVYDFVCDGDDVYTVMEFIDGRSLFDEIVSRGRIPYKQALEWSKELCSAAAYLHSRKPPIIHSDIKPQNIMITAEGRVCLIDFNISSVFDGGAYTVGSSDGYSPPEQYEAIRSAQVARGQTSVGNNDPTEILSEETSLLKDEPTERLDVTEDRTEIGRGFLDARSDVYSIGAVMYSMVTGQKPVNSQKQNVPVEKLDENIPDSFAYIVDKAMSRDKKDRFSSAGDMLNALNKVNKYDRRYKSMMLRHELAYIFCVALLAASVVSVFAGRKLMLSENDERFNSYIEEMSEICVSEDLSSFDELFERVISEYPDKPEPYYYNALKIYRSGDHSAAQEYINKNLAGRMGELSEEMRSDLYFMQADILFRNEDYAAAAEYYKKAAEDNPEKTDIYRDYAISLAKIGDTEKAEQIMSEAIERGLAEDGVYMITGELCFIRGEYEQAADAVEKVIELTDSDELKRRSYLLWSRCYRAMGADDIEYIQKNIAVLEQSLTDLPQDLTMQLREYLAQEYIDFGEISGKTEYFAEAYTIIEKMKALGWESYQSDMNMAVLLDKLGNTKAAAELLTEMSEAPLYENYYYKIYIRLARLEASMQNELDKTKRSYSDFEKFYSLAEKYYADYSQNGNSDPEMESLRQLRQELKDLNWID